MNDDTVLKELTDIFHQIFDDESIVLTPKTTANDIEEWDSFNHINIIIAIETRFGIKFQIAEIESLKNIGDAVAMIQKKLAAKGAA